MVVQTQKVTAADIKNGRIRVPAKVVLSLGLRRPHGQAPNQKLTLEFLGRGARLPKHVSAQFYDNAFSDRPRSGQISLGKAVCKELVASQFVVEGEPLSVVQVGGATPHQCVFQLTLGGATPALPIPIPAAVRRPPPLPTSATSWTLDVSPAAKRQRTVVDAEPRHDAPERSSVGMVADAMADAAVDSVFAARRSGWPKQSARAPDSRSHPAFENGRRSLSGDLPLTRAMPLLHQKVEVQFKDGCYSGKVVATRPADANHQVSNRFDAKFYSDNETLEIICGKHRWRPIELSDSDEDDIGDIDDGSARTIRGVINHREVGGETEYKVKFTDNKVMWCKADELGPKHVREYSQSRKKRMTRKKVEMKQMHSVNNQDRTAGYSSVIHLDGSDDEAKDQPDGRNVDDGDDFQLDDDDVDIESTGDSAAAPACGRGRIASAPFHTRHDRSPTPTLQATPGVSDRASADYVSVVSTSAASTHPVVVVEGVVGDGAAGDASLPVSACTARSGLHDQCPPPDVGTWLRSISTKPAWNAAVDSYITAFEKQEVSIEILEDPDIELDQAMLKELNVETMGHRLLILGARKKLCQTSG